jgi:predicted methyltransferase
MVAGNPPPSKRRRPSSNRLGGGGAGWYWSGSFFEGEFPMLKRALVLAAAFALPFAATAAAPRATPADVAAAVAAPGRPADAIAMDAGRRPAEVLQFMGLRQGDRALDLFTGSGYFAEIMGRAVGPTGSVMAWEPTNFMSPRARQGLAAMHERQPNVSVLVAPADVLALPAGAFDFAMINLNYHDTYWSSEQYHFPRMEPDAFLRTVFQSLKPGGTMAVIDHVANAGGDTRAVVEAMHRIDPATIRADFERAGFVFVGESNLLRNPQDDHSKNVFDPAIRGHTDRVVYRFRRPAR